MKGHLSRRFVAELAATLLVLASLAAWWVRSLQTVDNTTVAFSTLSGTMIRSDRGSLYFYAQHEVPIPIPLETGHLSYEADPSSSPWGEFKFRPVLPGGGAFGFELVAPHWVLLLLIVTGFGWRVVQAWQGRREPHPGDDSG